MTIVNAFTIGPEQIEPGDEMLFVVKAMVNWRGSDGMLRYRIYRCRWEGDKVPQGDQVADMEGVCEALFPSLAAVGVPG